MSRTGGGEKTLEGEAVGLGDGEETDEKARERAGEAVRQEVHKEPRRGASGSATQHAARHLHALKRDKPRTVPDPRLVALNGRWSPAAEPYRRLGARLRFIARERGIKTIAVTSTAEGEGRTITALNLGLTLARESRKRVLVVDCDLRRSRVLGALGLAPRPGVAEVIRGELDLRAALLKAPSVNLYLLPAGRPQEGPGGCFDGAALHDLFGRLGRWFDLVVIDAPAIESGEDRRRVLAAADGSILVLRAGRTPRESVIRALESADSGDFLGVVFNGAESAES